MRQLVIILVSLTLVGTLGYMLIEGFRLGDAFYLTVSTLTTVGYGDVVPVTPAGRLFSTFLMLGGVGAGLYILTQLGAHIVERRFAWAMGARRMRKQIEELSDHFIVCGYGRVGRGLAADLARAAADYVIVERDPTRLAAAREEGHLVLEGDATEEAVLIEAGVRRARGIAAAISDDAENLYITVSTRGLNPTIRIVARGIDRRGGRFLTQAGADAVILLDDLGASRFSRSLLHPAAVDLLDELFAAPRGEHTLTAVRVVEGSPLCGRSLRDLDLRARFGAQIVALKRDDTFLPTPGPDAAIAPRDLLLVITRRGDLDRLQAEAGGPSSG